jgi:hypothetical protein
VVKCGTLVEKEKVMSHPDPLFDPDNAMEDDMNYDDYDDFYGENLDYEDYNDDGDYDDSMDGDAESAFGSCGWGVDEYYREDFHGDDGLGYYNDD